MPRYIGFQTAALDEQYPVIARSRLEAWKRVTAECYCRATGLSEDDPDELWQFAIGQSEPVANLPDAQRTQQLLDQVRLFEGEFEADPKAYMEFRAALPAEAKTAYTKAVDGLFHRFKDDPINLNKHLRTLQRLHEHGPFTQADYKAKIDQTTQLLIRGWITERNDPLLLAASLCFYSDAAIVQRLEHLRFQRCSIPGGEGWPEAERIRKLCAKLGLVRAKPRLIQKLTIDGRVVPFASHTMG